MFRILFRTLRIAESALSHFIRVSYFDATPAKLRIVYLKPGGIFKKTGKKWKRNLSSAIF